MDAQFQDSKLATRKNEWTGQDAGLTKGVDERFFEIAIDMFVIAHSDGYFKRVNQAFTHTLGWSREEMLTRPFIEFVHPDDIEPTLKEVERQIAAGEEVLYFENRYIHKDGTYRVLAWKSVPQDGKYMYAVARDVTAQRQEQDRIEDLNKELEKRVDERTREIAIQLDRVHSLRKIDVAILGSVDLRVVFEVFLDQVTECLGVDAAAVLLANAGTQTLMYAAGRGFKTDLIRNSKVPFGKGFAGRAALERGRKLALKLETEPDFSRPDLVKAEGFASYIAVPLLSKGRVIGVLDLFHRTPLDPSEDWISFLETLAGQAAIAVDSATMFLQLERSHAELSLSYDATLEGWVKALDLRDHETEGHSMRVTELTVQLAHSMGLPEQDLAHIRRGALLHDIGKIGIPDEILLKPGKLDDQEMEKMKLHPVYAYEWLSPIRYLAPALDIPYGHHERWDGTGYPRGLKGESIPLAARIFAVIDVWDALRSDRPYRAAWSSEKTLEHIQEGSGSHFDPVVVAAFMRMIDEESERKAA